MFFAPEIFWGAPAKILDQHYKRGFSTDHHAKFHAGRPTHLGDFASGKNKKLEIWDKAQRESARRPKCDWGKLGGGGKISPASKTRGQNSNALAYAERALST